MTARRRGVLLALAMLAVGAPGWPAPVTEAPSLGGRVARGES